ncbi:DUF4112 domain-containing protein [Rubripirellula reticaptiva]|uniref:DUF4112 domain-containing protein n=1 Tax=Rubripirellula reticaptiva TaxID=2528013 RepID=A0A5C6FC20_9BACT|nr:DUF4112 domain-containing protein [Rubripirellula reticaptiva]TWU57844.1 hypothetical protein Poly59_07530 [Rubripirellula reticaptiva]
MKDPKQLKEIQMRADSFARLMDDAIEIPVLGIRLGWDSILGFIPGVGDVAGLLAHGFLVVQAKRAGARKRIYLWLLWYALIDFIVGTIPVLGDIFDIFWKSNRRGAAMLRKEITHQTSKNSTF